MASEWVARADAGAASLLLNLESAFTAVVAWVFFREATSRRVVWGFAAIFVGSLVLVRPTSLTGNQGAMALGAIAVACSFWALDANLTRKISAGDARGITAIKGLAAGATHVGFALRSGGKAVGALALGFVGYGLSLVLFIFALRNLEPRGSLLRNSALHRQRRGHLLYGQAAESIAGLTVEALGYSVVKEIPGDPEWAIDWAVAACERARTGALPVSLDCGERCPLLSRGHLYRRA